MNLESTKEIQNEYNAYLDRLGMPNINKQGFYVRVPLKNTAHSFVHLCDLMHNGRILLTDSCGSCYDGRNAAGEIANKIRGLFPDMEIWIDDQRSSEKIYINYEFLYTTIEDLHEHVLRVAEAVDYGAGIGKEMLGDDFER